jgi:hypothetical protein
MDWSHLIDLALGAWAAVATYKAKKAQAQAKRTATELDLIRAGAGTKASWEGGAPNVPQPSPVAAVLGAEARRLRDRGRK